MPCNLPIVLALLETMIGASFADEAPEIAPWPSLASPPSHDQPARKSDMVLVVGIGDYGELADIPGAALVATWWRDWFLETLRVPEKHVVVLQDAEATSEAIALALTELSLEAPESGRIWVVFTGHAATAADGRDVFFLGSDTPASAQDFGRGVALSTLLTIVGLGNHAETLVIADASLGGLDRQGLPLTSDQTRVRTWIRDFPDNRVTMLWADEAGGRAILMPGDQVPAFSYLALGALRGWADSNGDRHVSVAEVRSYTQEALHLLDPLRSQKPGLMSPDPGRIVASGAEAGPDLAGLLLERALNKSSDRLIRLQGLARELTTQAGIDWVSLNSASDSQDATALQDFVNRYAGTRLEVEGQSLWVYVPEASKALDRLRPLLPPTERDENEERRFQISGEMRKLERRNAWKGVEEGFQTLRALEAQGLALPAEDLVMGAGAARAAGNAMEVRSRLAQAARLAPSADIIQWLNDLEGGYGALSIRVDRKEPASLHPVRMPFAPDQRAAVERAVRMIDENGSFQGLLPQGLYAFGTDALMVIPGVSLECVLTVEGCRPQRRNQSSPSGPNP